jgi:hypothetical protein
MARLAGRSGWSYYSIIYHNPMEKMRRKELWKERFPHV